MNPKLEHRIAHTRVVAEVAELGRTKPSKNARFPDRIAESLQPHIELSSPKKDAHSRMYPFGYARSSTILSSPD